MKRKRLNLLCLLLAAALTLAAAADSLRAGGMNAPHSVITDPETGLYYVSNIVGTAQQKDNHGFIAVLDPSGKPLQEQFIRSGQDGAVLNAPRGLAIHGPYLYVADIDTLRRFDKKKGNLLGSIDLSLIGARQLNGLAFDTEGRLYAADTLSNTIFRVEPQNNFLATVFAKDPRLGNPSGLLHDARHKRLLVAGAQSGRILSVDGKGTLFPLLNKQFENPQGIAFDKAGNLIVADFKAGVVYRIKNYSEVEVLRKNVVTPAQLSFDFRRNRVLVPSFKGNLVFSLP